MSIKITYLYSACVKIETPDVKLLCDPWFTDGIYDGSWYQYPKLEDPLKIIGKVDIIWVSHIHPDHYDKKFLQEYLKTYPETRVFISDFKNNFLFKKMRGDGIKAEIVAHTKIGATEIISAPNENGSKSDIDSALVVKCGGHSVVNMNDNQYSQEHIDFINSIAPNPDIALLSYTGAGPYPQTYYDDEAKLAKLGLKKKLNFFERYKKMKAALNPKVAIPFAGKYVLGGKLAYLNKFRGIADAVEVTEFDKDAIVLDDGGDAFIDTADLKPSRIRTKKYAKEDVEKHLKQIENNRFDYEKYFAGLPLEEAPILRLMPKAYKKALANSECERDYYFCIKFGEKWVALNANAGNENYEVLNEVEKLLPRSEITIDYRYLFGLLTNVFHWNNAEVGSQYFTKRVPDEFDRSVQSFLNFLAV